MTTSATLPVLRALLDKALEKDYTHGVLGVHASPEWTEPRTFIHDNVPVRVETCVSALAVREALLNHERGQWLVVLTDRTDEDLGTGLLSHLVFHRLRTPDPWEAVRQRFAATGIDPELTNIANDRDIAVGLLATAPPTGWKPAPGGVLTRDHALGAVAAEHLGLTDPVVDISGVLAWAADPSLASRIADLRTLGTHTLADSVLDWIAGRAGAIRSALLYLLRVGEQGDAVPLGLVTGLLAEARDGVAGDRPQLAREALIRLEHRFGGQIPGSEILRIWATESAAVVAEMLHAGTGRADDGSLLTQARGLLTRADELLAAVRASGLADGSDLLPAGLTRRLATLADRLRTAVQGRTARKNADEADQPLITQEALGRIEEAWAKAAAHRLAEKDERIPAFHAAVRLVRWLAADARAEASLPSLLRRHGDHDAWADSAINDAAAGVSDPELGAALEAVLSIAWVRRAAHDVAFAAALAAHTYDNPDPGPLGILHVEDLLPREVMPLARKAPVLLLVLDGMSAGNGTEVMASILSRSRDDWAEALLPGQQRRAVALAALPTLTEVSRACLLCGGLRVGGQDTERGGFETLARVHGMDGSLLFHKGSLDSVRPGHGLADDIAAAIADVTRHPLVTCVLNAIDDALDRSDPGGTAWGTDTVKHLRPLLDHARDAGRVVILTADHGHVVDRRQGVQRTYPALSSSRSRAAMVPAGDGEVLVSGPRVLRHGETAVLAVDKNLRYGPLKAGYHGGASTAEVIVPVAVLVSGVVPDDTGLRLAPPQAPTWWLDPVVPVPPMTSKPTVAAQSATVPVTPPARPAPDLRRRTDETVPTLFDEPEPGTAAEPRSRLSPESIAAVVLKSSVYAAQKKIAGRVSVTDDQVGGLLAALLAAPSHRLAPAAAATTLQVSPVLLRGAVLHVQKLLNVEGYAVLRVDADGATLILDETLLRDQYGIRL